MVQKNRDERSRFAGIVGEVVKGALSTASMMLICVAPAHAQDIIGEWARADGTARVRISSCGADVCAVNTWIKPGESREKEGDRLIMKIRPDERGGGFYSGTAFDPQRDLTYKLTVKIDGNSMTTKGCVLAGIICKGVGWNRVR
jgi:uncharacterized protein (DUF2147 family)